MPDQPSDSPDSPQGSFFPEPSQGSESARGQNASSGTPPTSPDSVSLLNQILQRLNQMEGGLSQHEEWLRRIEDEQRPGESSGATTATPATTATGQSNEELQRLIGSLTLERDRAEKSLAEAQLQLGQYQQELVALRQRTGELQTRLTQRDQELAGLKTTASQGQQQARDVQTEAQRQLAARQQQLQSLQADFARLRQQIEARDQRIAELQATLEQSAERFKLLTADVPAGSADDPHANLSDRAWSRFARFALVAAFASAMVSVALTSWLYERSDTAATRTASVTLMLPGLPGEAIDACAKQASQEPGVQAVVDHKLATVDLKTAASSDEAAIAKLDALAARLLENLPVGSNASTTQPTATPEAQAIADRLAEMNQQLATATRPVADETSQIAPAELAVRWQQLAAEREQINGQLAKLRTQIETRQAKPAPTEVAPEQIAKAEATDQQLQAEAEALKQRQDQLAGRLRVSIDTAGLQFQSLQQSLTEADGQIEKTLQDNHPDEVKQQLTAIRESLKTWARATNDLDAAWKRQRSLLDSPGADVLSVQAELERSARSFGSEITPANTAFTQAIETIGQGQDQTTKRLVLRNALIKQLTPVTTAQQGTAAAARAVILTENVELAGIVQRFTALQQQLQGRRNQIAEALRQQVVTNAQKQQAAQLAQARQSYDELAKRADEISTAMLQLGEKALQTASAESQQAQWLAARTDLLARQNSDQGALLKLHEEHAARLASLPPPPAPGRLPAHVVTGKAGSRTLLSAILLGATPALACAAVLALSWLVISARRSRHTIEEYARTLKETARRASLPENE